MDVISIDFPLNMDLNKPIFAGYDHLFVCFARYLSLSPNLGAILAHFLPILVPHFFQETILCSIDDSKALDSEKATWGLVAGQDRLNNQRLRLERAWGAGER